jgi:hypothetical protein|tara:strand:- start:78 stop:680 length:603 start_codon:yes stop_codon:yes gene_type:complete
MGIVATASEGNTSYPQIPVGMHNARCVRVIDLGTQKQEFSGEVSYKRQVLIIWEVPEQVHNDEPMTISKFYTLSLHEKSNLGADLSSWRGRAFTEKEKQGFDLVNVLNVPCTLNIIEGNNGKSKVANVLPLASKEELPEQHHQEVYFSIEDYQQGNKETFNQLSEGIRNIILRSKELEGTSVDMGDENNGASLGDEAVPF